MNKYRFSLREEAPVDPNNPMMGGDDSSQTHNRYTTAVQDEFGIDDKHMKPAEEAESYILKKPINFASKWGFLAATPVPVTIKTLVDAGERSKYEVTFHLTMANKRKFIRWPWKKGDVPIRYEGPVEDKTEYMTYQEKENMKAADLQGGGAAGGAPPMGGDMMGGAGGAPPMGGPAAGAAAPPPGPGGM